MILEFIFPFALANCNGVAVWHGKLPSARPRIRIPLRIWLQPEFYIFMIWCFILWYLMLFCSHFVAFILKVLNILSFILSYHIVPHGDK